MPIALTIAATTATATTISRTISNVPSTHLQFDHVAPPASPDDGSEPPGGLSRSGGARVVDPRGRRAGDLRGGQVAARVAAGSRPSSPRLGVRRRFRYPSRTS